MVVLPVLYEGGVAVELTVTLFCEDARAAASLCFAPLAPSEHEGPPSARPRA